MNVICLLSSGLPLCELTVDPLRTVKDLRSLLVQTLQAQLGPANPSPPALAFAQHPGESRKETCSFIYNTRLKLLIYKGEEVADCVRLHSLSDPLCVLRPTDIVAYHCDCAEIYSWTVFNTEEGIRWGKDTSPGSVEIVIVAFTCYFICSMQRNALILTIKERLAAMQHIEASKIRLWHYDTLLENEKTLEDYGLEDESRLTAALTNELTSIACGITHKRVVFSTQNIINTEAISRQLVVLEPRWKTFSLYATNTLLSYHSQYLVHSAQTRLVTLHYAQSSISAVFPLNSTLQQAKECIEIQHGLAADVVALASEVNFQSCLSVLESGLQAGDVIAIVKKNPKKRKLTLLVCRENVGKREISVYFSDTISSLKEKIMRFFSNVSPKFELFKEKIRLEDEETIHDCGLDNDDYIYVLEDGDLWADISISFGVTHLISVNRDLLDKTEDIEQEDCEDDTCEQSQGDKDRQFLHDLDLSPYYLKVLAPGQILHLRIHQEATVSLIKSHLKAKLKIESCRLMREDKELDDEKRLFEQNVAYNDTLTLLTPSSFHISALTPSGYLIPAVLDSNSSIESLNSALGYLPGLPKSTRNFILLKRLREGNAVLPSGVHSFQLSLQVGSGAEMQLRTELGHEMRVEVNAADRREEVRGKLIGKVLGGDRFDLG